MNKDSRKHRRHRLTDTFIVYREGVFQVYDLSSGGFAFGCINEQELPEKLTVDIFNDKGGHIWDITIKTVWAKKNINPPKSSIHAVLVGAKFQDNLSPDHQYALNGLLYSWGEDKH